MCGLFWDVFLLSWNSSMKNVCYFWIKVFFSVGMDDVIKEKIFILCNVVCIFFFYFFVGIFSDYGRYFEKSYKVCVGGVDNGICFLCKDVVYG